MKIIDKTRKHTMAFSMLGVGAVFEWKNEVFVKTSTNPATLARRVEYNCAFGPVEAIEANAVTLSDSGGRGRLRHFKDDHQVGHVSVELHIVEA